MPSNKQKLLNSDKEDWSRRCWGSNGETCYNCKEQNGQQYQISLLKLMNQATPHKCEQKCQFTIADSGPLGDNSCVYLPLNVMEVWGLKEGNLIHISCPSRRKETLALLFLDETIAEPQILKMNHICRKNLAGKIGDSVKIKVFTEAVELSRVVVKKIGGYASTATPENHEQKGLGQYFEEGCRPICRDDVFQIKTQLGTMEFMITCTEPSIYGFVTPETMIAIDWASDQMKTF